VSDADTLLSATRRPLVLGIGGGGDVVGALATAEACRGQGAQPIVGGVTWERRPIDPDPGPRAESEIEGARRLAPGVLAANGSTRVRDSGDSIMLAAAAHLAKRAVCAHGEEPDPAAIPVLGGIFGAGCDGELRPAEVLERIAEVAAAGGFAGARGLTPAIAARLEQAVEAVPTEASAQALACFHGAVGETTIRHGRRTVELSPVGALTFYFDVAKAIWSAGRLAAAVIDAEDLEAANEILRGLGIRTELDYERDALHTVRPSSN
jgi:hypothetical protein